ncbi:MAG: amidohydrolase [Dehalococcoidales bacterium]|nr:amidohydrolase [Dehalococcoidales bacterium]
MPKADLVLKNANIITMDRRQPSAGSLAIKGGRILLAVEKDVPDCVIGMGTKIIDCGGRTVLPGFIDAHCHLFSFIRKMLSLDLSPSVVRSIEDIKTIIRRKAQETPPGAWIAGTDYNDFYLAEKRHPNRQDLDEAAPDNPVVLSHRGLHCCVLNSMALALANINRETSDPPDATIERDLTTGEPTGVLFEMLGYVRGKIIPQFTDEELNQGMILVNQQYLKYGITSIHDATVRNDYERWQVIRRFKDSGRLKSRVYMMAGLPHYTRFAEQGMKTGDGDADLRLGAVKVMTSTATGWLLPEQRELNRIAFEISRAGFQLAFHAVEEEAVISAVSALEYVAEKPTQKNRRHRIEHCSECITSLIERMHKLGTVVVTQPPFVYYSGERYLATLTPYQLSMLYRFKSIFGGGVPVAASSDSPVVGGNPLVGVYAAVTRKAENGQSVLLEESISVKQALEMYTINAAYASFEEDVKGSIIAGKLADMVVLSSDPTQVPPDALKDIKVEMTIIGGMVVWDS